VLIRELDALISPLVMLSFVEPISSELLLTYKSAEDWYWGVIKKNVYTKNATPPKKAAATINHTLLHNTLSSLSRSIS
jgi:hypothetical protein